MKPHLLTVGHSNMSIEQFIELLNIHEVKTLVDVRSRPYTKYTPHFSREQLAASLKGAGIDYYYGGRFLGGLDGPSVDNPIFIQKMEAVINMAKGARIAMMCAEKDPAKCHRAYKLAAWSLKYHPEVPCSHIVPARGLVDAKEFQAQQKPTWGWHELFEHGEMT